ncbi:hypothetical protein Tco_0884484 [Tanacetum coccineum]
MTVTEGASYVETNIKKFCDDSDQAKRDGKDESHIVCSEETTPPTRKLSKMFSQKRSIHFYRLSHSELDDIEKVAVCSSLRLLKIKNALLIKILRVLRIILVVLLEHPSDTKVLTMKMEILLEPTSNKLLVDVPIKRTCKYGDSDGYTFNDPILILEILSRRFLLRGIYLITGSSKDEDGDTSFQ